MAPEPIEAIIQRDQAMQKLRDLTWACFMWAAGMVAVFSVIAAVTLPGQSQGKRGLPDPWNVLDEQVSARQQTRQRQADRVRLAAQRRSEHGFELAQLGERPRQRSGRALDCFPHGHY